LGKHGKYRALVIRTALTVAFALATVPAQACRLALVLAIDVSNSVDETEDQLQRAGLANALLSPNVGDAFFISEDPVALLVFEWSGRYHQKVLVEWRDIITPLDLTVVSETIRDSTRGQRDFPTAMGYALGYAATRLREKSACFAKTIDIAGDGKNNDGFGPTEAYNAFEFANVTVNGLVVDASILETREDLIAFFTEEVIRGPASFVEVADGFDTYEETMRRKLIRELLSQMVGDAGSPAPSPRG
jgi:hypothetical protein